MALNAAITCRAKLVSLKLCRCGALTAVYWLTLRSASTELSHLSATEKTNVWRDRTDVVNVHYLKIRMSPGECPSQLTYLQIGADMLPEKPLQFFW